MKIYNKAYAEGGGGTKPRPGNDSADLVRADRALSGRDTARQIIAPACIQLIVGVLAVMGLLSLVAPKSDISAYENRKLAASPVFSAQALVSGEYIKALELYYADTFPLREPFVRAAARIKEFFGPAAGGVRIHNASDPAQAGAAAAPLSSVKGDEPLNTPPPAPDSPPPNGSGASSQAREEGGPAQPAGEKQGPTFLIDGKALPLFGGSATAGAHYARVLNDWRQALGPDIIEYNLVVPSHIEFYPLPEMYQDVSAPQKPNIDAIYGQLSPGVKAVDAYAKLAAHKDEYLYFGTDHHWTALGAYYAYTAFCETAGFTPVRLESLEKRSIENFIGTLYSETMYSELLNHPDHVDYWMMPTVTEVVQYRRGQPFTAYPSMLYGEYAKSPNCYSVFLQGDYPLTKITTSNTNGRKIAVVKESFGNAFSPFLTNHYQEIYVVDQRYFELNLPSFMQQNGIGEILFINNIFAANTGVRINEIDRLRTQVYVPPAPAPEPEPPAQEEESSSSKQEESSKPRARKRVLSSSSARERPRSRDDDED